MASEEFSNLSSDHKNDDVEVNSKPKTVYTPRQIKIFVVFSFVNVCSAMCYSIQAPFYPAEAEKKGVTPAVYGFVFGVFELVTFIVCPIYGTYIREVGPKFMLNTGNFVMAICCIMFGFLDRAAAGAPFIGLSFAVRIVEALGQAGFLTASFAIIAYEFPNDIAKAFSIMETFFGVGIILGPTVGGVLYEIGGFLLPFLVNGGFLLFTSIFSLFILPDIENVRARKLSITKLLRIPSIAVCYYAVFAVAFSFGFTFVLLEPQLRQFDLSPALVGVMFVIAGITYAITAIAWGYLADNHVPPMILCGIGGIIISIAFTLLGPAPYIPFEQVLWLEVIALILHGIGTGAEYIAAFIDSSREAIAYGFPDNIETYGLIAGLWASGLSLGSFVGPTLTGLVEDSLGFRGGTQIVVGQQILVVFLSFGAYWHQRTRGKINLEESQRLLQESRQFDD